MNLGLLLALENITEVTIPHLDFVGKYLQVLAEWLGSIGWAVILFTLTLKLITFPLDYMSRASMKKNSIRMERMKPQLDKLQKQYANDKTAYQQEMMKIYKKEGYSMVGSCLPTVLTLIFFLVVFQSFNTYSRYQMAYNYNEMVKSYNQVIIDEKEEIGTGTITEEMEKAILVKADVAAQKRFTEVNEGFWWVRNIWLPDNSFKKEVPDYKEFKQLTGTKPDAGEYKTIVANLNNRINGYFIFPVIGLAFSILSQFVMQKQQKEQQQMTGQGQGQGAMKVMMWMMPIMIGIFSLFYSTAFNIYMISNSVITLLTTFLINFIVGKTYKKKLDKDDKKPKVSYSR